MPKSPGKKSIGVFRLTEIRYHGAERTVSVRKDICVSNKLSIDVKPIELTVFQTFEKKCVRIGEKITSEVLIINLSKIIISGFDAEYEGDSSGLKQVNPARTLKNFPLTSHGKGTVSIDYKTIRAGDINLGRMIIGKLRIGDHWLNCAKPYYSNPAPMLHVESVRLPGINTPVIFFIKEVDLYLKSFVTKVIVIALGILAILLLVELAIRSVLVDFFFGRVMLNFILVAIAELFIIFFVWGLWWCFRSIFPPWWTIPVIISCCCILYIAYMFIFYSSITYRTLLPGIILAIFSYILFVGLKAFEHHQFENFPKEAAIVIGIVLGIAMNIFLLRKELRRKNG
jgi:hypothetical protein